MASVISFFSASSCCFRSCACFAAFLFAVYSLLSFVVGFRHFLFYKLLCLLVSWFFGGTGASIELEWLLFGLFSRWVYSEFTCPCFVAALVSYALFPSSLRIFE
ncbi:hypothetical protein C8J56DRAFT_144976 [Mycena floridula]|nr:hypothetical protein C8J56DRAFT_144976 [Mycena floridula]